MRPVLSQPIVVGSQQVAFWVTTRSATFHPTHHHNMYELHVTAPQPEGVHFQDLLEHFNVHLPHVPVRRSRLPTWHFVWPFCGLRLIIKHMVGKISTLNILLGFCQTLVSVSGLHGGLHWWIISLWFWWLCIYKGQVFSSQLHSFNACLWPNSMPYTKLFCMFFLNVLPPLHILVECCPETPQLHT
jgi:hypothetical protein